MLWLENMILLFKPSHLIITTTIRLLLEHEANVNAKSGYYNNILQAVVYNNNKATIRWLLKYGANMNAEGGNHNNALQASVHDENKTQRFNCC